MTEHPSERDDRRDVRYLPEKGEWPCQQPPNVNAPPQFVTFLYLLLRDGAQAPGDVEQHAINAGLSKDALPDFTNPHLLGYAWSLAEHLLAGALGVNDRLRVAHRLEEIDRAVQNVHEISERCIDGPDTEDMEEIQTGLTVLEHLVKGNPGCNEDNVIDQLVRQLRGAQDGTLKPERPLRIVVAIGARRAEDIFDTSELPLADYAVAVHGDQAELLKDRRGDSELVVVPGRLRGS